MKFHLQNYSDTKTKLGIVIKAAQALWHKHFKDIQITRSAGLFHTTLIITRINSNRCKLCVIKGLKLVGGTAGKGSHDVLPQAAITTSSRGLAPHCPQLPPGRSAHHHRLWEVLSSGCVKEPGEAALNHRPLKVPASLPRDMLHTREPVTSSIRARGQSANQGSSSAAACFAKSCLDLAVI